MLDMYALMSIYVGCARPGSTPEAPPSRCPARAGFTSIIEAVAGKKRGGGGNSAVIQRWCGPAVVSVFGREEETQRVGFFNICLLVSSSVFYRCFRHVQARLIERAVCVLVMSRTASEGTLRTLAPTAPLCVVCL